MYVLTCIVAIIWKPAPRPDREWTLTRANRCTHECLD